MVQILDASESSCNGFVHVYVFTKIVLKGVSFIYALPQYHMGRDSLKKAS